MELFYLLKDLSEVKLYHIFKELNCLEATIRDRVLKCLWQLQKIMRFEFTSDVWVDNVWSDIKVEVCKDKKTFIVITVVLVKMKMMVIQY